MIPRPDFPYYRRVAPDYLASVDPEVLRERIAYVTALDLSTVTDEELDSCLKSTLLGYPDAPVRLDSASLCLYRARLHSTPHFYRYLTDLWYPPHESLKSFGRCNRPDEPVLYCGNPWTPAILELYPKSGDFITVVEIVLRPGQRLTLMPLGNAGSGSAEHLATLTKSYLDIMCVTEARKSTASANVESIRRFVEAEFTKQVPKNQETAYRISAWLFASYTRTPIIGTMVDGVVYTSVACKLSCANFAIATRSADLKLQIRRVFVYEFLDEMRVRQVYRSMGFGPAGHIHYTPDNSDKIELREGEAIPGISFPWPQELISGG